MKKKLKPGPATALLDAHVAFVIEQLGGKKLRPFVEELVDAALDEAGALPLEALVSRETVKAALRHYLVEFDLGERLPEVIRDLARALHDNPAHDRTRLGDLLSQARFEELLDQCLALRPMRRQVVEAVIGSPFYERMASDLLYNGIRDYLVRGAAVSSFIPGARSAMKLSRAVIGRATSGIEASLEEGIKKYLGSSVGRVSLKTAEPMLDGTHDPVLREAAVESWRHFGKTRLGELRASLSSGDMEGIYLTLLACWKDLRTTPFVRTAIDDGVERYFAKYGTQTVNSLLDDCGIARSRIADEAQRFAPQLVQALHKARRLEPLVRGVLEPFYRSGRVEAALKDL